MSEEKLPFLVLHGLLLSRVAGGKPKSFLFNTHLCCFVFGIPNHIFDFSSFRNLLFFLFPFSALPSALIPTGPAPPAAGAAPQRPPLPTGPLSPV